MKISTTSKAWIASYSSLGPDSLKDPNNITDLAFSSSDMKIAGWTLAGTAEITVDIVDPKTMIANKVESLRSELSEIRAKAQMDANRIESRINDLLCLTFESSEEA